MKGTWLLFSRHQWTLPEFITYPSFLLESWSPEILSYLTNRMYFKWSAQIITLEQRFLKSKLPETLTASHSKGNNCYGLLFSAMHGANLNSHHSVWANENPPKSSDYVKPSLIGQTAKVYQADTVGYTHVTGAIHVLPVSVASKIVYAWSRKPSDYDIISYVSFVAPWNELKGFPLNQSPILGLCPCWGYLVWSTWQLHVRPIAKFHTKTYSEWSLIIWVSLNELPLRFVLVLLLSPFSLLRQRSNDYSRWQRLVKYKDSDGMIIINSQSDMLLYKSMALVGPEMTYASNFLPLH